MADFPSFGAVFLVGCFWFCSGRQWALIKEIYKWGKRAQLHGSHVHLDFSSFYFTLFCFNNYSGQNRNCLLL
jgi:hypothetical protein